MKPSVERHCARAARRWGGSWELGSADQWQSRRAEAIRAAQLAAHDNEAGKETHAAPAALAGGTLCGGRPPKGSRIFEGRERRGLTAGLKEMALMAAPLTGFSPFGVASADALEPHTVFFVPVQIGGAGLNRLSMGWAACVWGRGLITKKIQPGAARNAQPKCKTNDHIEK